MDGVFIPWMSMIVWFFVQDLGLVITGTLPVFNKTFTGTKVGQPVLLPMSKVLGETEASRG